MLNTSEQLALGRSITGKFVGDNHTWNVLQPFEQFAEELFSCVFVPSALHQDVEHVAMLINCSPEIMFLTSDCEHDLVHMPFVAATRAATTQFIGVGLPKFEAPLSHGFIRHN